MTKRIAIIGGGISGLSCGQLLKEKGFGDKMVVGMDGHFQFCDYDNNDDEILIC